LLVGCAAARLGIVGADELDESTGVSGARSFERPGHASA
jgi:hypothetical protein